MHVDQPLRDKPLKTAFGSTEKPWKHSKTHRVSFFRLNYKFCGLLWGYCCLIFYLILTPYKLLYHACMVTCVTSRFGDLWFLWCQSGLLKSLVQDIVFLGMAINLLHIFCQILKGQVALEITNNRCYSTHCNTAQIWSWCIQYSSSVVNRYPAIYVISCVGQKTGKIKIVFSFYEIKLCFVSMCWVIKQLTCSILRNIPWF